MEAGHWCECVSIFARVRARLQLQRSAKLQAGGAELLVARTGRLALHGTAAGALIQRFWLLARGQGSKLAMRPMQRCWLVSYMPLAN